MSASSSKNRKARKSHVSENLKSVADSDFAAWELAVLDVFVRAAAMFGFRKSVAFVFGALYCSREPESAQTLQEKLKLSRGAVVEALQFLRRLGAVRVRFKIGDRRDFYEAETDLKKFVRGFLKEVLVPAMEKADVRLAQAESAVADIVPAEKSSADAEADAFPRARVDALVAWKTRFSEMIPLLENLLDDVPAK